MIYIYYYSICITVFTFLVHFLNVFLIPHFIFKSAIKFLCIQCINSKNTSVSTQLFHFHDYIHSFFIPFQNSRLLFENASSGTWYNKSYVHRCDWRSSTIRMYKNGIEMIRDDFIITDDPDYPRLQKLYAARLAYVYLLISPSFIYFEWFSSLFTFGADIEPMYTKTRV